MSTKHSSAGSNTRDDLSPAAHDIPEDQRPQWQADIAALHDLHVAHEQSHLQLGDLYNELKERWDVKMPALTKEAGVSYHAARQRAHIAELGPPGSKLRATGLSYSILRLLAPLADPEPWAQLALAQQSQGQLRVRQFAQTLVDAGVRRSRPRRSYSPPCLNCDSLIGAPYGGIHIRGEAGAGWLCGPLCAAEYFAERKPSRRSTMRHESQSRAAAPVPIPKSELQNPEPPLQHESQSPAASLDILDAHATISHAASLPPARGAGVLPSDDPNQKPHPVTSPTNSEVTEHEQRGD